MALAQGGSGAPAGHLPANETPAVAVRHSEAARAALAAARTLAGKADELDAEAESAALQAAAMAYDKVATDFAAEPPAAAQAMFAAAELWRRHGSLLPAEQDYLAAARLCPERFGQRGKLGAADMQRRLERDADAIATYAEAAAAGPTSSRAQVARLWQGRLLQKLGRLDEAVAAYGAAVTAARTPTQVVEASNCLARLLVDKGDLEAAVQAIARAESSVATMVSEDPAQRERLQKALDAMSARRALQRARDRQGKAVTDAEALERSQKQPR